LGLSHEGAGLIKQESWMHGRASNSRIAVVVYNDCSFLDLGMVLEVFDLANEAVRLPGVRWPYYCVDLLSSRGGQVRCTNSLSVETILLDSHGTQRYDALFIAGGPGASASSHDKRLSAWLKEVFHATPIVQASGSGTLLLRQAGLPNDRGAIIPIRAPGTPQRASSKSELLIDIKLGSLIITALALVKSNFDFETAEQVADQLMPFSRRWLGQILNDAPYSNVVTTMRDVSRWIEEHCARPITVEEMANGVSMGERTFFRHFKAEIGMAPSEYLLRARLTLACRLLVTTTLPIDKIARRCGMGEGARLAKIFRRHLGISASDYRTNNRDDETGGSTYARAICLRPGGKSDCLAK